VAVPSGFAEDDDIKLCVVWDEDSSRDPEALLAYLARALPHFMVPRYIETVPSLPKTPTNKVRKSVLRAGGVAGAWDRKSLGMSLEAFTGKLS
jgi:crotonobetaine/carnitine-CoA ligase